MGLAINNPEIYCALIGAFLHLTNCIRPDILFAVGVFSTYSQSPCAAHWEEAPGGLKQCCRFSRNIAYITPKIIYFNIKKYIYTIKVSNKKIIKLKKKTSLV